MKSFWLLGKLSGKSVMRGRRSQELEQSRQTETPFWQTCFLPFIKICRFMHMVRARDWNSLYLVESVFPENVVQFTTLSGPSDSFDQMENINKWNKGNLIWCLLFFSFLGLSRWSPMQPWNNAGCLESHSEAACYEDWCFLWGLLQCMLNAWGTTMWKSWWCLSSHFGI